MKNLSGLTKLILVLVICSFATGCVYPRRIIYVTPAVTEWWKTNIPPTPLPDDSTLNTFPTLRPTIGPVVLAEATLAPTNTPRFNNVDSPTPTQAPPRPVITPTPYNIISYGYASSFETELQSGVARKIALSPSSVMGAFIVDVTPLEGSVDGAHIEYAVLPEHDGEQWVDTLSILLSERAPDLMVRVDVYNTISWRVVWQDQVELDSAVWHGYAVQDASTRGAYAIEINPLEAGEPGYRIEKAIINPEFISTNWVDVLRLNIPQNQPGLPVLVKLYQSQDFEPYSDFNMTLKPGDWPGSVLGPSSDTGIYVVEITPTTTYGSWIERYIIQPEFDGRQWNDVLRMRVPDNYPVTDVNVRVYRFGR